MSLIERARERIEEVRTRVESIRGGSSSPELPSLKEIREKGILATLGGSRSSSSPELPSLKEIREKGVLTVLEEKFPRVREMRERGVLGRHEPEPKGEVGGEMGGKEISLRVKKEIHGDAI